ncbi:MAG: T9SS type A sorting domain-containing protein [Candidatus Cloacimonetes bacterium]|nr:T9SS type A sorting domain-containing protein [Candidatus Cloacimonadota bacterium]
MKRVSLSILILALLFIGRLGGVNHMDLLFRIDGEFNGSYMGHTMVSLDYNCDGYDDLIASAMQWNPESTHHPSTAWGKLYYYMGGPGFDDVAEYAFSGDWVKQYIGFLNNAGDVNGDGKDDFLMFTYSRNIPGETGEFFSLYVFYGKEVPTGQPDYILNVAYADVVNQFGAVPLGDINNDGFDDLGLRYNILGKSYQEAAVLLGSSSGPNEHILFPSNYGPQSYLQLNGIGDVNGDGVDDFHLLSQDANGKRYTVFFGSDAFPELDSLIVCDNYQGLTVHEACPVGDVNGDETDDFFLFLNESANIWFGNSDLSPAWDVVLYGTYFGTQGSHPTLRHGDFNGDGYEDIVGTDHDDAYWDGKAGIWLGGAQFNGTVDLTIYPPQWRGMVFGWGKAAGDFNGDGYCDLAISSPFFNGAPALIPGFVYIYSGNAELKDTTVSNHDDVSPPVNESSKWDVLISPNPVSVNNQDLSIHFIGEGYKKLQNARIELFNIRGQMISDFVVDHVSLASGQYSTRFDELSSGVYFLKISDMLGRVTSRKFIVK